jgi:hypothetical protein
LELVFLVGDEVVVVGADADFGFEGAGAVVGDAGGVVGWISRPSVAIYPTFVR